MNSLLSYTDSGSGLVNLVKRGAFVFENLGFHGALKVLLKKTLFIDHYYLAYVDLNKLIPPQKLRLEISLNRVGENDIKEIIDSLQYLDSKDKTQIIIRLFFLQSGFKNCYVARTRKGEMAYFQWIVYPSENEIIEKHCRRMYSPLKEGQVMLENVFTYPKFRGLGLFPGVSYELLRRAKDEGYKHCIVYIRKGAIMALNEFFKLGFKVRKLEREYKFLGLSKRV